METISLLAQFWGWMFVLLAGIYLLRGKTLTTELFLLSTEKSFVVLTGYISLLIGLISLILYHDWTSDWRVAITIFGWIALIKGVTRLSYPKLVISLTNGFKNQPFLTNLLLVICIVLGGWLVWLSA